MTHVKYFWDEQEDNVVREYDEANNTLASYTTEPTLYGSVLTQDRGGEKRYFQFDGIGNTNALTDSSGSETDTRRYSAFGTVVAESGTTVLSFQYAGRLGYITAQKGIAARFRVHSAAQGRWHSADPLWRLRAALRTLSFVIRHPQFVFANNDPVNRTDPTGLTTYGCFCTCSTSAAFATTGQSLVPPPVTVTERFTTVTAKTTTKAEKLCEEECDESATAMTHCFGRITPNNKIGSPTEICNYLAAWSRCAGCTKEICLDVIANIKKVASTVDVPYWPGWEYFKDHGINRCDRWEQIFHSKMQRYNNPCFTNGNVDTQIWSWFIFGGHAATMVTFCNGAVLYVDAGGTGAGGSDRLAVCRDLHWNILLCNPSTEVR